MISENLKKAVEQKDLLAIRSSFYTIIMADPAFKTKQFDEALSYVKAQKIEGFMDAHNGEELIPEAKWDEAYFDMLSSKLQDNFSEERIQQIKTVSKKLYAAKNTKKAATTADATSSFWSDYSWVGWLGVVIAILLVLKRLFKGGK